MAERLSLRKEDLEELDLAVRNSGLVYLQYFEDYPDGNLAIGEARKNIPFKFPRFYFINKLNHPEAIRGKHAHKKLRQVIFCINGSFDLSLDDGEKQQTITMDSPYVGIQLNRLIWHEMTNFSQDCVILVVADDYFKKKDYIRDYDEFLRRVKKQSEKGLKDLIIYPLTSLYNLLVRKR